MKTQTKERPILFSDENVRHILDGRKNQTRRTSKLKGVNENPDRWEFFGLDADGLFIFVNRKDLLRKHIRCPYGEPGEFLWVRTNFWFFDGGENAHVWDENTKIIRWSDGREILDCEPDLELKEWVRKSSIFMPRWASRITLEIKDIRVERLQVISEDDARAEGVPIHVAEHTFQKCYRDLKERAKKRIECFTDLWNSIHGPEAWNQNPWVWVIEFERVEP